MPAPEYPVRCFLCNELAEEFAVGIDPVGASIGERRVAFYAHHECMRAAASPDFNFPSREDLDNQDRELAEQWRAELEAENQSGFDF